MSIFASLITDLDPPLVYYGSGALPNADDERRGAFDLATVPGDREFLRVWVWEGNPGDEATVVLPRADVERIHAALTKWLATDA